MNDLKFHGVQRVRVITSATRLWLQLTDLSVRVCKAGSRQKHGNLNEDDLAMNSSAQASSGNGPADQCPLDLAPGK